MKKFLNMIKVDVVLRFVISMFSWESILEIILKMASSILGEYFKEAKLNVKKKMFTQVVFVIAVTLGDKWSKETDVNIDNVLVDEIKATTKKIADVNKFSLPTVPGVGE